jgi:hypothetical protein
VQVLPGATVEVKNAWAHGVAELASIAARENRLTPAQRQALHIVRHDNGDTIRAQLHAQYPKMVEVLVDVS